MIHKLKLSDNYELFVCPLPLGRVRISLEKFNSPDEWGMQLEAHEAEWLKDRLIVEKQ